MVLLRYDLFEDALQTFMKSKARVLFIIVVLRSGAQIVSY